MTYYTGVGSRSTPPDILITMIDFATSMAQINWTLRSGGADGADTAFESGAGDLKRIYTTEDISRDLYATDPADTPAAEALEIAGRIHPAWQRCKPYVRKLHARNVMQVLGDDPRTPVLSEFLVCWTPGGKLVGGTRTAIVVARENNIPVWNLGDTSVLATFERICNIPDLLCHIPGRYDVEE